LQFGDAFLGLSLRGQGPGSKSSSKEHMKWHAKLSTYRKLLLGSLQDLPGVPEYPVSTGVGLESMGNVNGIRGSSGGG